MVFKFQNPLWDRSHRQYRAMDRRRPRRASPYREHMVWTVSILLDYIGESEKRLSEVKAGDPTNLVVMMILGMLRHTNHWVKLKDAVVA